MSGTTLEQGNQAGPSAAEIFFPGGVEELRLELSRRITQAVKDQEYGVQELAEDADLGNVDVLESVLKGDSPLRRSIVLDLLAPLGISLEDILPQSCIDAKIGRDPKDPRLMYWLEEMERTKSGLKARSGGTQRIDPYFAVGVHVRLQALRELDG